MKQTLIEFSEDLELLHKHLTQGIARHWTPELRKNILHDLHRLKSKSRRLGNVDIENEITSIETTMTASSGAIYRPDQYILEAHLARITELDLLEKKKVEIELSALVDAKMPMINFKSEVATKEGDKLISAEFDDLISIEPDEFISIESDDLISIEADELISSEPEQFMSIELDSAPIHELAPLQMIICKCLRKTVAREVAIGLVNSKLATSVDINTKLESIYWLEGKIKDSTKCQLQIITTTSQIDDVIGFINTDYVEEVTDIIVIPMKQ